MRAFLEQRTKGLLRRFSSDYVYVVRRGMAKGLKRKGGLGFVPQFSSLSAEERFLLNLEWKGKTVYDIGAYEGVMTLFFARSVGKDGYVIAFEPNPANVGRLHKNIALNRFENVTVKEVGLGGKRGAAQLAVRGDEYATGSIDPLISAQILEERGTLLNVQIDTLDHRVQIDSLPLPHFIKIDVEGYELNVLMGMTHTIATAKPAIFIELHGASIEHKRRNANEVIRFLKRLGYMIYHVESSREIDVDEIDVLEGHIYCQSAGSGQTRYLES